MGKVLEAAAELERKNAARAAAEKPVTARRMTATDVEAVVRRQRELLEAAEAVLIAKAENGHGLESLTPDDWLIFEGLQWDAHRVRRELQRCELIPGFRLQAGTTAERKAARERLATALERSENEGEQLREELQRVTAELNGKIAAIDNEVSAAQKVCDGYAAGVMKLRGAAPERFLREAQRTKDLVRAQFAEKRNEISAAIKLADRLRYLDPNQNPRDRPECASIALLHAPECINTDDTLKPDAWKRWAQSRIDDMPALRQRLIQADADRDAAVASADSVLDCYLQ